MSQKKNFGIAVLAMMCMASGVFAANVTPDVIFGSGNANGSFTVDQSNGIELGLRGKLRHNAAGLPENTFNYDGVHTYTFMPGVAPTQSFPTAEWSFEWSINSDYEGTSDVKLDNLTYALSMTSSTGTTIAAIDVIDPATHPNGWWDHAIGDNSTGNGGGTKGTAANYAGLIAANNVAQNSWKPSWFAAGFNPNAGGTYDFVLEAFDAGGSSVARTAMTINAVPLPAAAWGGMMLLGALGLRRKFS